MLWNKSICYHVAELEGDRVLLRGELLFDRAAKAPPPYRTHSLRPRSANRPIDGA